MTDQETVVCSAISETVKEVKELHSKLGNIIVSKIEKDLYVDAFNIAVCMKEALQDIVLDIQNKNNSWHCIKNIIYYKKLNNKKGDKAWVHLSKD